jgi:predicted dehydrogenase
MKVGIIGASFAKAAFLPALRHVEGAEVVAIASARAESAAATARQFGIGASYGDWPRILDVSRVAGFSPAVVVQISPPG